MLSSFKFREVNFQKHDPNVYLKEYLKQLNVWWPYSHEYFLLGDLIQQRVLVKSRIPTPEKMVQTNREAKRKRAEIEKNKAITECNTDASSSSLSLYNIDSNNEDTTCASNRTPSLIREISLPPNYSEEMDISHATIKSSSKKHCLNNSVVLEQEGPLSYTI